MAYLLLCGAIIAEVLATSLLKATDGFSRLIPTMGCLASYGVAFFFLAMSISRGMSTGVAYAMWAAIGTALIVGIGTLFLGEPLSAAKIAGVGLIIGGVLVLNLAGAH